MLCMDGFLNFLQFYKTLIKHSQTRPFSWTVEATELLLVNHFLNSHDLSKLCS